MITACTVNLDGQTSSSRTSRKKRKLRKTRLCAKLIECIVDIHIYDLETNLGYYA